MPHVNRCRSVSFQSLSSLSASCPKFTCWSFSVHSLCSVSQCALPSHVHLHVPFSPFPLLCFSNIPYCLMYNICWFLSFHSPCSVSAFCPMSHVQLLISFRPFHLSFSQLSYMYHVHLQVSFGPFPLLSFITAPYGLM